MGVREGIDNEGVHPVLELLHESLTGVYTELATFLNGQVDPNRVFEERSSELLHMLRDTSLGVMLQLIEAKEELDEGKGYVIVRNTGIESMEPEMAQLAAITLASIYGQPTRTDQRKLQIAWPIKYDPKATGNQTFSQTMGEAAYHTDTQYFEKPEKYFGLFCVVSDQVGKGTNILVDGAEVMRRIDEDLPEIGATLRSNYPFRVPTVFTKSGRVEDVEVVHMPIMNSRGNVRYRRDTLLQAASLPGYKLSEEQIAAIETFERYLTETPACTYHLQPGEALFVNNHRLLHARTPYDNPNRLLYRVRMAEVE